MGLCHAGTEIIKAMGSQLDIGRTLMRLDDDHLFTLFLQADEADDRDMAESIICEIERRCEAAPPTIHEVPKWLQTLLPSALWHQKPGGGGE